MLRLSEQYLVSPDDLAKFRGTKPEDLPAHKAAAIAAASADVVEQTRRAFLKEAVTATLDGSRSDGPHGGILRLPYGPVDTGSSVTVTEDGTTLTVATGYSTTADVVVDPLRGLLHRRPGSTTVHSLRSTPSSWAEGTQNIVATYTAGDAVDESGVPAPIKQVTCELAWIYLTARPGNSTTSRKGRTATFIGQLTPLAQATLRRYTRW